MNHNNKKKSNWEPKFSDGYHNKSLVLGSSVPRGNENNSIASFINDFINKNNLENKERAEIIKNSMECSNSSYLNIKNMKKAEITKLGYPSSGKSSENFQPSYLNFKQSNITNKPEILMNSFENGGKMKIDLKFPDVSVPPTLNEVKTSKNTDIGKKLYKRFDTNSNIHSKLLPSIKNNKILNAKNSKRVSKNRDQSMTVIKSGRLALKDNYSLQEELKKNASMSRESSKKTGRLQFPMSRKEASLLLEDYLYSYEQMEILEYDKIYFFNITDRK